MTLEARLLAVAKALPSDSSSVTFSRADLYALIEVRQCEDGSHVRGDLTVEQVAEEVGRSLSTVRGWLSSGALRGYKLNGRDWRVTRRSLDAYLEKQRTGAEPESGTGEIDITDWRKME